jgi:hypothetical protein
MKALVLAEQAVEEGQGVASRQAWTAELTSLLGLLIALPVALAAWRLARSRRIAAPRTVVLAVGFGLFSLLHTLGMSGLRAILWVPRNQYYVLETPAQWLLHIGVGAIAYILGLAVLTMECGLREQPASKGAAPSLPEIPLAPDTGPSSVELFDGARPVHISIGDLIAVRGGGNYVELIFAGRPPMLLRTTMRAVQAQLEGTGFQRLHKSWLVLPSAVQELNRTSAGDYSVQLSTDLRIPLSRRNKAILAELRRQLAVRDVHRD